MACSDCPDIYEEEQRVKGGRCESDFQENGGGRQVRYIRPDGSVGG